VNFFGCNQIFKLTKLEQVAKSANFGGWQPLHLVAFFQTSADKIIGETTTVSG